MRSKLVRVVGGVLALSMVGNLAMGIALSNTEKPKSVQESIREVSSRYPYLAATTATETQNDYIINFTVLRERLNSYLKNKPEVGLYFEYLPTGSSISHNAQMEVKLASLAKTPAVMAVYKQIELGRIDPDTTITLKPEHINKEYGTLWKKGAGSKISLKEAVELTLQESDNTAALALASLLPDGALDEVFKQFDLPRRTEDGVPVLSPKGYSSIMRNLYLASYLDKEHSNYLIEVLTGSTLTTLLAAGVPDNIPVAHKMGILETPTTENNVYSDCGIFYVERRPYMLCIMTTEPESEALKDMPKLSKMVYEFVAMSASGRPTE